MTSRCPSDRPVRSAAVSSSTTRDDNVDTGAPGTFGGVTPSGRFEPLPDPRPDDRVWPDLVWPVPGDVELVGSSVRLTRLDVAADVEELFAVLDHPEVWANLPVDPGSVDDYAAFLRGLEARDGWHAWTVRLERPTGGFDAGTIVGTTSYLNAEPSVASVEIGATAYAPAVWGTVVNPECKLLLLGHAFDVLGAGRVQIKTDVRNARSQQAIARLGAQFEGVLRRHFRRSDGTVRDTVMFSVIAEEWPSVRAGLEARGAAGDGS